MRCSRPLPNSQDAEDDRETRHEDDDDKHDPTSRTSVLNSVNDRAGKPQSAENATEDKASDSQFCPSLPLWLDHGSAKAGEEERSNPPHLRDPFSMSEVLKRTLTNIL